MKILYRCEQCGELYILDPTRYHRSWEYKYCSNTCKRNGMHLGVERVCKRCRTHFWVWPSQIANGEGIYCSTECIKNSVTKICRICGTEFEICKASAEQYPNKYCSKECYGIAYDLLRVRKICVNCGNEFRVTKSKDSYGWGIYCTKKCQQEYEVGENSPQWKGGVSPLHKVIRMSQEYLLWRTQVFERDDYRDWFSGCRGSIEAHHIVKFSDIIKKHNILTFEDALKCKELWDVNNGVTMLKTSHRAYHDMIGW